MCGKAKAVQFVCVFSLAIKYSVQIRSRSLHNILKSFYGEDLCLGREMFTRTPPSPSRPNWAISRGGPSTRATRDSSNTFPYSCNTERRRTYHPGKRISFQTTPHTHGPFPLSLLPQFEKKSSDKKGKGKGAFVCVSSQFQYLKGSKEKREREEEQVKSIYLLLLLLFLFPFFHRRCQKRLPLPPFPPFLSL